MRSSNSYIRLVSVALFAPLVLTGCATFKAHPGFSARHETIRHLAVLPPDVEAYEVTFNAGNKPLADLKTLVEKRSTQDMGELLKEKGYDVATLEISQDKLEQDARLKEAWFDMQMLYKQALADIKKNKKKEFTYDVGSGPNYFAENHKADVIVLTRQTGTKLSQGMIQAQIAQAAAAAATAILVGVAIGGNALPWFSLNTEIAFVDAESGDILWYNFEMTTEDYTRTDEKNNAIFKHLERILKPFPDSKFKKPQDKKPDAAATEKSSAKDKAIALPAGKTGPNFGPAPRPTAP